MARRQPEYRVSGAVLQLDRIQVHAAGRIRHIWVVSLGDARITTIALRHVSFFSIVLWRAVRTGHVAVAAADTNVFINHHKAIFTLMHCAAGADFCTCGVIAMVTGDGEIISEHVLVPDAIIFLPVAASVFINTAETDFRAKIFKIFARQFAGFTASTAAGIDKNPYCVVMGYSLNLFDLDEIAVRRVSLCQR